MTAPTDDLRERLNEVFRVCREIFNFDSLEDNTWELVAPFLADLAKLKAERDALAAEVEGMRAAPCNCQRQRETNALLDDLHDSVAALTQEALLAQSDPQEASHVG